MPILSMPAELWDRINSLDPDLVREAGLELWTADLGTPGLHELDDGTIEARWGHVALADLDALEELSLLVDKITAAPKVEPSEDPDDAARRLRVALRREARVQEREATRELERAAAKAERIADRIEARKARRQAARKLYRAAERVEQRKTERAGEVHVSWPDPADLDDEDLAPWMQQAANAAGDKTVTVE